MFNPATHSSPAVTNEFTKTIINNQKIHARTRVRLRNETMVYPIWLPAHDETCQDFFLTEDSEFCWNPDGTSVTGAEYDMMEIMGWAL